jgi:Sec-independent protein secretion pathway component TatC
MLIFWQGFYQMPQVFYFSDFCTCGHSAPPDVISQVLLAIPLIALFETGILVSRIARKRAEKRRAGEQ